MVAAIAVFRARLSLLGHRFECFLEPSFAFEHLAAKFCVLAFNSLLQRANLMLHDDGSISEDQFPKVIKNGDLFFPVRYEFEPTRKNDGLNVEVTVDLLHQVNDVELEWLVP